MRRAKLSQLYDMHDTYPTKGHWEGELGPSGAKIIKERIELNWNSRGGGGLNQKMHLWGQCAYIYYCIVQHPIVIIMHGSPPKKGPLVFENVQQ